jgi:hypothetical protein
MFPLKYRRRMGEQAIFCKRAKPLLHFGKIPINNYLDFLAFFFSAAAALAADLAKVVGLRTLLGLNAFRILKAAHPVPIAWPAASSPSLVASPACSPYLQDKHHPELLTVREA